MFFFFIFFKAMLLFKCVYLLITITVFKKKFVNGSNQLHIGGIFPIAGKGGWQGGQGKQYLMLRKSDPLDLNYFNQTSSIYRSIKCEHIFNLSLEHNLDNWLYFLFVFRSWSMHASGKLSFRGCQRQKGFTAWFSTYIAQQRLGGMSRNQLFN